MSQNNIKMQNTKDANENNLKKATFYDKDSGELFLFEYIDVETLGKIYCNNNIYKQDRYKYYNLFEKVKDGAVYINYEQNLYSGKSYGRFYPVDEPMCGTYMWRKARSTLYGDHEYDIDLKTAHQSITEYLIKKYCPDIDFKKKFPLAKKYIDNRDEVIEMFNFPELDNIIRKYNKKNIDILNKKDIVKKFHNIEMYGGYIDTWLNEFEICKDQIPEELMNYLNDYEKERIKLMNTILEIEEFETMIKDIEKQWKKDKKEKKYNKKGSLLSLILQNEETKIIVEAIKFISEKYNDIVVTIYCYDGFQIRPRQLKKNVKKSDIDDFVKKLNSHIQFKFNSKNIIQFINKPFSEKFTTKELNDINYECKYLFPYFTYSNIDQLSEYIYYVIKNKITCNNSGCYHYNGKNWELFDKNKITSKYSTVVYESFKKVALEYLPAGTSEEMKYQKKIINTTSNNFSEKALKKAIDMRIKKTDFDTIPHLLNCNNGTINLDTFELQPHDPKNYCSKIINLDAPYDIVDGKKIIQKVKYDEVNDVFLEWFEDGFVTPEEAKQLVEYLLYTFGKSLHGVNFIEKAVLLLGRLSRNGKSTTMDILKKVLNDYMVNLNLSYLTTVDHKPNEPHPELLSIKGARIVQVDEPDESNKIIPGKFKTLVGGDTIKARDLYKGVNHMIEFKNSAIFYFLSNYQLKFTTEGNDTSGKITFFEYCCFFGDELTPGWQGDLKNDKGEKIKKNHKDIKPGYKNELLNNKDFLNKMFATILAYSQENLSPPEIHIKKNAENIKEINTVANWCDENIKYDKNDVYFTDKDWLIKEDLIKSLTNAYRKKKKTKDPLKKMLTFDFLYTRYKKDIEDPVSKKNFITVVSTKYNNFIGDKPTRYFGGQKRYIHSLTLKNSDDDEEEKKEDKEEKKKQEKDDEEEEEEKEIDVSDDEEEIEVSDDEDTKEEPPTPTPPTPIKTFKTFLPKKINKYPNNFIIKRKKAQVTPRVLNDTGVALF